MTSIRESISWPQWSKPYKCTHWNIVEREDKGVRYKQCNGCGKLMEVLHVD